MSLLGQAAPETVKKKLCKPIKKNDVNELKRETDENAKKKREKFSKNTKEISGWKRNEWWKWFKIFWQIGWLLFVLQWFVFGAESKGSMVFTSKVS